MNDYATVIFLAYVAVFGANFERQWGCYLHVKLNEKRNLKGLEKNQKDKVLE